MIYKVIDFFLFDTLFYLILLYSRHIHECEYSYKNHFINVITK